MDAPPSIEIPVLAAPCAYGPRRRPDPAKRILEKLRKRETRARGIFRLRLSDVRALLRTVEQVYIDNDLIELVKTKPHEPMALRNITVKRIGGIIRTFAAMDCCAS